jgi:transcriptional regulator with XRE-family HTH domain
VDEERYGSMAGLKKKLFIKIDLIKKIQEENNWSVYEIAKRSEKTEKYQISTAAIFQILHETNKNPSFSTIEKLAHALQVNPLSLIGEK